MCHAVLEANWREGSRQGTPYAYTAPSPRRYPWQWYWDSCFTAIAWRRLDPRRARRELEISSTRSGDDGFIGHTIFWGRPVDRLRSLFYNLRSRDDFMTSTIQPPLLAWAWRLAVGDAAEVPKIARHHDWVERERAIDGDGLLWIVQPDESGLDASPKFDSAFGWHADGLPGFPLLVRRNRRLGFDIRRIEAAGGPVVCGTATNVMHGLSRLALGRPSIRPRWSTVSMTSAAACFIKWCGGARGRRPLQARRSPGRRCHRSRCPTFRKASAGAWLSSTSLTPDASGCRCLRRRCRQRTHASRAAIDSCSCAAIGAAPHGSTQHGSCGLDWSGSVMGRPPRSWLAASAGRWRPPGCGSTTTPTPDAGWALGTSPGHHWSWS